MSYSQDGHGFFTRALDAEDRGRLDEAETAYQQAIVLFEEEGDALQEQAACHYNLGHLYLGMNRPGRAVTAYEKALELFGRISGSTGPGPTSSWAASCSSWTARATPRSTCSTPWASTSTRPTSRRTRRSATSTWPGSTS